MGEFSLVIRCWNNKNSILSALFFHVWILHKLAYWLFAQYCCTCTKSNPEIKEILWYFSTWSPFSHVFVSKWLMDNSFWSWASTEWEHWSQQPRNRLQSNPCGLPVFCHWQTQIVVISRSRQHIRNCCVLRGKTTVFVSGVWWLSKDSVKTKRIVL